jgi:hypothetical protein
MAGAVVREHGTRSIEVILLRRRVGFPWPLLPKAGQGALNGSSVSEQDQL